MDDKRAIFLLKNIIEKVKEARKDWKLEFHPHLTFAEEDAINYAINKIENKSENGYISKDEYERRLKEEIQEHCDHDWVGERWVDACFYESTCRKCGKVETFYERD